MNKQAQKLGKDASENLNILKKSFQKIIKIKRKDFQNSKSQKILKIKSFQNIFKN